MDSNSQKDPYREALDEASLELRKIRGEYEKMCVRWEQMEKLVQALESTLEPAAEAEWRPAEHMSDLDGLTVVTRLIVLKPGRGC